MAYIRRVLHPIRASISVLSSTNSSSLRSCTTRNLLLNGNYYKHLNTWVKGIEPVSQGRASRFYDKLNIQKNVNGNYKHLNTWVKGIEPASQGRASRFYDKLNIQKNVRKIGVGSFIGMSVITGVMSLWSQDAYAMNETDVLEEAHISNFWDSLEPEDDQYAFVAFAKRFWMPALLVITMVMSWDRPFTTLAVEVFLYLLSTKPGALSVYVFIEKGWSGELLDTKAVRALLEQESGEPILSYDPISTLPYPPTSFEIRRQCIRQDPYSYIRKSSYYAKRVDVEDYVLLQLATVEFGDQEITLIGILGSWWVVNCTPCNKNLDTTLRDTRTEMN